MRDATPVFLDTSYLYALINTRDQWRDTATGWRARVVASRRRRVTTQFVLVEFADGLAQTPFRLQAAAAIAALAESDLVHVVPAGDLFDAALALYRSLPDKAWSLTDCASFVAMRERGLSAALTSDHHFRQAGFVALMLDDPEP
jgi:uncharacterized protein